MDKKGHSENILFEKAESFLPSVSIDCIVFGFHEGSLKILLNKFYTYHQWMLPGGFVFKNESVDDAAYRILKERTSLNKIYLKQFHLFGDKDRINLKQNENILLKNNISITENGKPHWLLQRFISVGYYAFVEHSKVNLSEKTDEEIGWFDLENLPDLYSDHNNIVEKAISTIRMQLGYLPIGYELLPEKFTMTELRIIYETISGKKLDRRNFQRKMLSSRLIEKLDEVFKKKGIKSTTLFSFNKKSLNQALENGMPFFD